jgi:hypothetical protein
MTTVANYDINEEIYAKHKDPLEDLLGINFTKDSQNNNNGNSKSRDCTSKTNTVVAFKYSNNKRGPLHESVILAGHPMFIKYENGQIKAVEQIDEGSSLIRPPSREESPYPAYEFAHLNEVQAYINRANNVLTSIESLHSKLKEIVLRYIDQEEATIIMLVADVIWSYFQDLFPTTHYIHATGDNETGKSTIGFVFQYTGYRPVRATAISAANYYRTLGAVEPGQCTIIEDEAENIEEDVEKLKILNGGYEYTAMIPKINMNSKDQHQTWFYGYCFKIIISNKLLSPNKAKSLIERTFTFHCKPAIRNSLHSIKDVIINPPGDHIKQKLYQELMDFRKLMLCYRLIHYTDHIPDIDIGLRNRDKELGGPLLRIFYGTKVFGDIKYALEKFLAQRKDRKQKTIEFALQTLIVELLAKSNNSELSLEEIWNALPSYIPGGLSPHHSNEYQTNEYGTLYRNTLSQKIEDIGTLGATRKRKSNGSVLIFDGEKVKELKKIYESEGQDKGEVKNAVPDVGIEPKKEDAKTLGHCDGSEESEGNVSSEGYRACGFVFEGEIQE